MNLHTRKTKNIIRHKKQIKTFKEAFNINKLHHSWLLEGPKGVGKATFAYCMTRAILSIESKENNSISLFSETIKEIDFQINYDKNNIIHKNISDNTHVDLKVIENEDSDKSTNISQMIAVDKVREAKSFFSKTSGEGGKRILILDSLDNLNLHGSNALLKIIEEPPKNSLIFLISNNNSNVLSTIKSRCRKLKFNNLSIDNTKEIISNNLSEEIDDDKIQKLNILSNGAPGKGILFFQNNGIEIYEYIIEIFTNLPNVDIENSEKLYNLVNSKNNLFSISILIELITIFISRTLRKSFDIMDANITLEEENAQNNLLKNFSIADISSLWENTVEEINEAILFNLDKKQTIINVINSLKKINSLSMNNS